MFRSAARLPVLALILLGGCGGSGDADPGPTESALFPPVTDFAAPGPFVTVQGPAASGCTVHRPEPMGEGGVVHPVILWGNGTGAIPGIYAEVLAHWASHGFIVAAANTRNAGSGAEMLDCLAYLEAENDTEGSVYQGLIDLDRVAASGHSQGGGGAIMVGRDPRVSTTAPLQPYIAPIPGGGTFDDAALSSQTGPMFLMSGSEDAIAVRDVQQAPVFAEVNTPVFWGTLQGADHIGSAIGDIGGYRGPATAWLRLHLMDDASAEAMFFGADCTLCADGGWVVETRGLP